MGNKLFHRQSAENESQERTTLSRSSGKKRNTGRISEPVLPPGVWYRHSGDVEETDRLYYELDKFRTEKTLEEVEAELGDYHITHLFIQQEIPQSLTSVPPLLTELRLLQIDNKAAVEKLLREGSLKSLTKLTKLHLSGNYFSSGLPACVPELTSLEELNLLSCRLTDLPPNLKSLTKLRKLDLFGNDFSSGLPACVSELTSLEELDLRDCSLTDLPPNLKSLTKLRKLVLSGNYFSSGLPACVSELTSLEELDLRRCSLTDLPPNLKSLTKLTKLDLYKNNFSSGLPACVPELTSLEELNLFFCRLTDLPPNLKSLTKLTKLDLYKNNFSSGLPACVPELTSLEELNLFFCRLTDLPPNLKSLTKLRKLDLFGNDFSSGLPACVSELTSLEELDLRDCSLTDLPPNLKSLTKLTKLDLDNNNFSSGLPACVPELTSLEELNLLSCGLTDLPPNLKSLTKLRKLVLSGNYFSSGLPACVPELTSLEELNLFFCRLTDLPPNLKYLTKLTKLRLWSNNFSSGLPACVPELTSLEELNLLSCGLTDLPPNFSNLEQLEELVIRSNDFQELPSAVYTLKSLHSLDIGYNRKLEAISGEILQLSNLKSLNCSDCDRLKSPPSGVCKQGLPAIRQYFIDLAAESAVEVTIAPIAVLGDTMGGKTSLIKSLQAGERQLTHREEASTLDEATKIFAMGDLKLEDSELKFIDFGGHRVYHIAYQLTLKEKCVPIFVVNMKQFSDIASKRESKEATRRLCFDWIAHIYLSCPRVGAPILVMTHRDQLDDKMFNIRRGELMRDIEEIRQQVLKEEKALSDETGHFCQIVHLANTSLPVFAEGDVFVFSNDLNERSNISALLDNLQRRCQDFKETIPALWERVSTFIEEQTYTNVPYILVSDIENEFPNGNIRIILRYMYNIGKILWYENIDSLSKYIFPQIQAITSMMSLIFDHTKDAAWKERVATFSLFRHRQRIIEQDDYKLMVKEFLSSGVMDEALLVNLVENHTSFPYDVALALLQSFQLVHGPIQRGLRYNYIIPQFSTQNISRSWSSDGYIQLRADINFKGLPIPEYVYQLATVDILNFNSKQTNKFEVFRDGTTIRHGKTSTHLVHDHNNSSILLQISTTPELLGPSWERLMGTVQHVIQQITSVFKAARAVTYFYCSHCIFLREPIPDLQVNPSWFQPHSHIESFSGTGPVPCHNTEGAELEVLKPLKFPCYELTPSEISELKDYLAILETRRHVPAIVVDAADQSGDSEETGTAMGPVEYEDSDLSDVEQEGYAADTGPKVVNHRLKATSQSRIKALYDNPGKVYQMSDSSRGRALIININTFNVNGKFLCKRPGSEVDYSNLSRLFTAMKFDVVKSEKELTDLTAEQIFSEIRKETALPAHGALGMFVLVIMSHGSRENILFDRDHQPVDLVKIKDLLSPVHFPAMRGKPKLVIIQACSGGRVDLGNMEDVFSEQPHKRSPYVKLESVTLNVDDFFVMKASSESYIATRSRTHGSWFIRVLVATFYKHACHRDVETLFKIIQSRVRQVGIAFTERAKPSTEAEGANVPVSQCTFTNYRKLYFFPRYFGPPPPLQSAVDE